MNHEKHPRIYRFRGSRGLYIASWQGLPSSAAVLATRRALKNRLRRYRYCAKFPWNMARPLSRALLKPLFARLDAFSLQCFVWHSAL